MTDHYTVFGNPIEHSKSPLIHSLFAEQTGQDMHYDKQLVALEGFEAALHAFIQQGGKGLNITVPFKEEAYRLADSLSKRARQAGAVNTYVVGVDGAIQGDNTDGIGMVRDISDNLGWPIAGKTVLLLGAGGAVRGVLGPLLAEKPARVFLANRTVEKAQNLAKAFSRQGDIEALGFDQLPHHALDLIINGTSASLGGDVPPIPKACIGANSYCYDMMYSAELTPFLQWAQQQGCTQVADGLGMLVEQAAEAFYLWRGVRPQTADVIKRLREI